jgi:hypothetical protein|nr:MAG TPA: hypothetical protein [Caudoviricetes sp.]
MKKIVSKLVECGFSFEYENRNSNGEKITVWHNGIIIESYQGRVTWSYIDEEEYFDETDFYFDDICQKIEQVMIDDTSSFN